MRMQRLTGSWRPIASRLVLWGWLLAALFILVACQPPDVAPQRTTFVRIAGASAMQPVLYELTTAFTRQHPTVLFELSGGGSTTGEERVMAGQVNHARWNTVAIHP